MTKIEWTEMTLNVSTGCTSVSRGCSRCYARTMHKRLRAMGQAKYQHPFSEVRFHPETLEIPLRRKKPTTYFINSMSDLFHESLTFEQIARVYFVMVGECSTEPTGVQVHTFKILTKRPGRMLEFYDWARGQHEHDDPEIMSVGLWVRHIGQSKNLHLGVSIEDQKSADERVPLLLQTPAAVRFLSIEPLLSEINLGLIGTCPKDWGLGYSRVGEHIHQAIVGCESGPKARPMDIEWVCALRDECVDSGTSFFFKQAMINGKLVKMPALDGKVWAEMPR